MGVATGWLMEGVVLRRHDPLRMALVSGFVDSTCELVCEDAVDTNPGQSPGQSDSAEGRRQSCLLTGMWGKLAMPVVQCLIA